MAVVNCRLGLDDWCVTYEGFHISIRTDPLFVRLKLSLYDRTNAGDKYDTSTRALLDEKALSRDYDTYGQHELAHGRNGCTNRESCPRSVP